MSDCINRVEAIDVINHVVIKFPGLLTNRQQKTVIETMKLTKNAIENALIKLPSVNPSTDSTTIDSGLTTDLTTVELKKTRGKWLPHMVTAKCESIDRDVCSECRTCFYGEPTWSWKYCPKCGADMTGNPKTKRSGWNKYNDDDPKTWPEDGSWGLWQHKSGALNVLRWKQDAQNHFYPDPYMWNIEDVVAWMPLPDPYEP